MSCSLLGYSESKPVMAIKFSRYLAILLGIITPIAETLRRWHQLNDLRNWPFWLDDFLLGGFLLYGAWRTRKDIASGQRYLAAAWGFACGMIYPSFFTQLTLLGQPDPSSIPSVWVAVIKGIGFALAIAALVTTLTWKPEQH